MTKFSELRIYAIRNDVEPMWMNKDNLQLCINNMCPIGGATVERDLTEDYIVLQEKYQRLKELLLLTDDSVSDIAVGKTQIKQWAKFIAMFPDEELRKIIELKQLCQKCKREIPNGAIVYKHPDLGHVCEYCPEFNDGDLKITDKESEDE